MWALGVLKSVVTRPVIVPLAVGASGLTYGSFKLSKKAGAVLFDTDPTSSAGNITSYAIGTLTGVGALSIRNMLNPHKETAQQLWRSLSVASLQSVRRVATYHVASLAISGVAAGLGAAYTLPAHHASGGVKGDSGIKLDSGINSIRG